MGILLDNICIKPISHENATWILSCVINISHVTLVHIVIQSNVTIVLCMMSCTLWHCLVSLFTRMTCRAMMGCVSNCVEGCERCRWNFVPPNKRNDIHGHLNWVRLRNHQSWHLLSSLHHPNSKYCILIWAHVNIND